METRKLWLAASALLLVTCDTEPASTCGDGVVASGEACDDHNLADGDGCSSTCEIEDNPALPLACMDLVEAAEIVQDSMVVTTDGRVLVTGSMRSTASSSARGWVGAFDQQGAELWSLEFDEVSSHVHQIRTKGSGFVFIHSHDTVWDVVEIDGAGNTLSTLTLGEQDPGSAIPIDLLDTPQGLLLGGASHQDLWLGRANTDGSLETLAVEDYAGLDDRILELQPNGTGFAALAIVAVVDNSSGDSQDFDTLDTLLLEYDDQGNELRRTHLSSGDEQISLSGAGLLHGSDGTWFVAGSRWPMDAGPKPPNRGWVTAIHEGEVVWSREFDGTSSAGSEQVQLDFFDVVGTDTLLVAGRLAIDGGYYQPYLARIAPADGQLDAELLGAKLADGSSIYWQAEQSLDDRVWLLGSDRHADRTVQWLCNTQP